MRNYPGFKSETLLPIWGEHDSHLGDVMQLSRVTPARMQVDGRIPDTVEDYALCLE